MFPALGSAMTRILTHAAIGGCVGALAGVVVWFFKRGKNK
jgi:hypothetical protein